MVFRVRFAYEHSSHDTAASSIGIKVTDHLVVYNLSIGEVTSYFELKSGRNCISIFAFPSDKKLIKASGNVEQGDYTAVISLPDSFKLLRDRTTCPRHGTALVRMTSNEMNNHCKSSYIVVRAGTNVSPQIMQNGVMQNGVMQNGVMQNGVMQNGVMQNGVMTPTSSQIPQQGVPHNNLAVSGGIYTAFSSITTHDNNVNIVGPPQSCETVVRCLDIEKFSGLWYSGRNAVIFTPLWTSLKMFDSINQTTSYAEVIRDATFVFPSVTYIIHKTDYCNYALLGTPTRITYVLLTREPSSHVRGLRKTLRKLGYTSVHNEVIV